MRTPPIKPGQPCKTCDRPMRPSKTTAEQHPRTVTHHTGGNCGRCHQSQTRAAKPRLRQKPIKPGQPCKTCKRPMRPQKSSEHDHPGTVEHSTQGNCGACAARIYNATRDKKNNSNQPRTPLPAGTPCTHCNRPMRDRHATTADNPGTILHWAKNYCDTCHQQGHDSHLINPDKEARRAAKASPKQLAWYRKTQQLPPRPDGLTHDELQLRIAIEDLINSRRRRGIPPEGIIPQEMELAA